MSISERLKSRRIKMGLTQTQLALLSGVRQQTIHRIESGTSERPRNLLEIADALECSAKWLLHGDLANAGSDHAAPAQETNQ